MLHSSSENHRHATAGDALASDLKRVESLCKLPHTVIDGWNIECGDRATAEATFGVSTVTTNELFVENAWSHLCSEGLRMKLANFQIKERTTMNSMMSTVAYWDPPEFDFHDTRYNETLPRMGKNVTYIVGGYVSANQRILKVEGEDEFCMVEAGRPHASQREMGITYTFRSASRGVFDVCLNPMPMQSVAI